MIDQEALQQDFFIYVPGVSTPAKLMDVYAEAALCVNLLPRQDKWIRIPLTEELVVYARMLSANQLVALC